MIKTIGSILELPIECQVQTIEQYRDSKTGFAAHTKLSGKSPKLKNIPGTGNSQKYTDIEGKAKEYREYLSYLMHASPTFSITKTSGNEFAEGRTTTTTYDLYESFRLISRVPKKSSAYRVFLKYFENLYKERSNLIPTGDNLLPKYLEFKDIPNPNVDYTKYNQFFNELKSSLKNTLEILEDEYVKTDEEAHGEH